MANNSRLILDGGTVAGNSHTVSLAERGAAVQIVGSFSGTANFEVSVDGDTWIAAGLQPAGGGALVTTATGAGLWFIPVYMLAADFRVRISVFTSGDLDIYYIANPSR
jgi:hypothetical protein